MVRTVHVLHSSVGAAGAAVLIAAISGESSRTKSGSQLLSTLNISIDFDDGPCFLLLDALPERPAAANVGREGDGGSAEESWNLRRFPAIVNMRDAVTDLSHIPASMGKR